MLATSERRTTSLQWTRLLPPQCVHYTLATSERERQPLYSGQDSCPPVCSLATSERGITSLQWTRLLPPIIQPLCCRRDYYLCLSVCYTTALLCRGGYVVNKHSRKIVGRILCNCNAPGLSNFHVYSVGKCPY